MKFASFQLMAFDGKVVTFTRLGPFRAKVSSPNFSIVIDGNEADDPEKGGHWEKVYNKVAPVVFGSQMRNKRVKANATNSMVKDLDEMLDKLLW